MARSAQTNTAHLRPVWHKQSFRDHAGNNANRLRFSPTSTPIPHVPRQSPPFVFQVYSTVPIATTSLSEGSTRKQSHGDADADVAVTDDLKSLGEWLGGSLSEVERPSPIWEIYEPQPDVLSCIEHQKREIAHRKATGDHGAILIPTVSRGPSDMRRTGFCIVVTSDFFRQKFQLLSGHHSDPKGPLWVRFHRPLPSVSPSGANHQTTTAIVAHRLDAEDRALPEAFEITIEQKQHTGAMQSELSQLYFHSCAPGDDGKCVGDLVVGAGVAEALPDAISNDSIPHFITRLAEALSNITFNIQHRDGVVTISNSGDSTPSVKYTSYVLLKDESIPLLETVTKAFTHAISSHLASITIQLDFIRPPQPNLSSVLSHAHRKGAEPEEVGVLRGDLRVHLLARDDFTSPQNDPERCDFEPYRTFVVVIDKLTNFEDDASGVLFLLTNGGRQKPSPADPDGNYFGPSFDNVQTEVWRCQKDAASLARRLAM